MTKHIWKYFDQVIIFLLDNAKIMFTKICCVYRRRYVRSYSIFMFIGTPCTLRNLKVHERVQLDQLDLKFNTFYQTEQEQNKTIIDSKK